MSHSLTLWAWLDANQWRLVSDTETALCQNEAKASEAIKVVKACYVTLIHEAEALYMAAIREVEANHSTSILEVEGCHTTAVKEVEAVCVAHAFDLKQAHGETIWALESEAIKEDRQAWQAFLQACRVALQACPAEALGVLMHPIQLLTGNMSLTGLLMAASKQTINRGVPSPRLPALKGPLWWHTPQGLNSHTAHLDATWDWTNLEMNPNHAPKSCPYEDERRGIPWWGAWRVPTRRPSVKSQT